MKKIRIAFFIFILCSLQAAAQTWYRVDTMSGQQTIAFNTVIITPIGNSGYWGPYCSQNLNYRVGQVNPGGYAFSFSIPVRAVRFRTAVSNVSERLSFSINGSHYNIQTPMLDTFNTGCSRLYGKGIISSGDIICNPDSNIFEQVVAIEPGYSIYSAQIDQTGSALGTIFDFYFSYDYSYVAIKQPFKDTLLCIGDSLLIPYTALAMFNPGNVFTAQLSDANGSFANPVNIGSIVSYTPDTIRCKIPLSTNSGTKYRMRIVSTDRKDTSATNGVDIKISNYPKPVLTSNSPACEGTTLTMSASNITPVDSYIWIKPGIPPIPFQSITFPNVPLSLAGNYVVESWRYGCKGSDTITIIVKPRPVPPTISSNSPVCSGDTLFLSANGASGAGYLWRGPVGFSSASKDIFISNFTKAKQGYYYAYTEVDSCLSLPDSLLPIVGEVPKLVASSNGPLCSGAQLVLNVEDTAKPSVSGLHYTWTGPGGYTDTLKTETVNNITTDKAGRYIITAVKYNCADTDTTYVTVIQMPPKPSLSSNSPVCAGKELQLTAVDSMPGLSYKWTGPLGFNIPSAEPVISNVSVGASGTYTATVNNNGCTTEDTISVLVKPVIIPEVSSNSPLGIGQTLELKIINPVPGVSYAWEGPDGFSSALLSPTIKNVTEKNSGTYIVTTYLDGCIGSKLIMVQIGETDTGVFHLYPNPNNGNFKLKGLATKDQTIRIQIYNASGQLLYSEQNATANRKLQVNISLPSAASGVYYLRVRADGKAIAIPFVINYSP